MLVAVDRPKTFALDNLIGSAASSAARTSSSVITQNGKQQHHQTRLATQSPQPNSLQSALPVPTEKADFITSNSPPQKTLSASHQMPTVYGNHCSKTSTNQPPSGTRGEPFLQVVKRDVELGSRPVNESNPVPDKEKTVVVVQTSSFYSGTTQNVSQDSTDDVVKTNTLSTESLRLATTEPVIPVTSISGNATAHAAQEHIESSVSLSSQASLEEATKVAQQAKAEVSTSTHGSQSSTSISGNTTAHRAQEHIESSVSLSSQASLEEAAKVAQAVKAEVSTSTDGAQSRAETTGPLSETENAVNMNNNNNRESNTPQTKRPIAVPSKCTRTMGSSLFPRPCLSHAPTLNELQSRTFSDYIRDVVLRKALPKFEGTGDDENDFEEDEWTIAPMPLTEGIGKVVLPDGFWKEEGIGKDRTGRGPAWQKGQPLGDLMIEMPISQHVRGMAGVYEYIFTEVPPISIAAFRERGDEYRKGQVGAPYDEDDSGGSEDEENRLIQLDRHFWKRLGPTMPPAWYGADQEGTLFGDDQASGWSLGELDSCLHVLSRVPGVTTPYLYAGMWASVFCAHTEDMNLLSINYLHAGAPKIWYAIAPGPDAKRFEALCEFQYPVAARVCKEFMRHKRHLLSPMVLQKAGIKYTTAIQRPGDAIITFPGGYHFGFNTGFNVAEATNFGVPEWIPFGLQARVCLCRPDSVRIDMNRLIALLEVFECDRARKPRLSWKEWSRKREEKKTRVKEKKAKKSNALGPESSLETKWTLSKKRKLLSEQEKKNEFWVEVVKPTIKTQTTTLKRKQQPKEVVEEEVGRGKRQRKKSFKAALLEEEFKEDESPIKVGEEEVWHLAKPIGRKGVDVDARVLCLLPGTVVSSSTVASGEGDMVLSEDEEDEQCFTGAVVERADDHVRVHLDGLTKADDVWVQLGTSQLYLDGGRWVEGHEQCEVPYRHYWKEMDSKARSADV